MSTKPPLQLVGEVDTRDSQIEELRGEIESLRSELIASKREFATAAAKIERRAIVTVLGIIQTAMHDVASGKFDLSSVQVSSDNAESKWEAIKQRLAPRLKEAIDILLIQGPMRRTQLASAMKMDYSNCVKNVVAVLIRQGLLIDNGRELSLKEL